MAVNKTILEGIRLLLGYLITITKMPNKKLKKLRKKFFSSLVLIASLLIFLVCETLYIVYQTIDEFDR